MTEHAMQDGRKAYRIISFFVQFNSWEAVNFSVL